MPSFKDLPVSLPELRALYNRLGEQRVRSILDRFYSVMAEDVMIGFFFEGKDLKAVAKKQGDFLLKAMGAVPSYSGKSPAQAHQELAPILPGHFDRRLRILKDILRLEGLGDEDMRSWISFENTFREAILTSMEKQ